MTIHELLQAAGLTANDEIPIWDADGTGEPTKKITAQQLAAAVVILANLVTSVNNQTGAVSITPANIGAVSTSAVIDVAHGGTNATTPDGACANIGAVKKGSFTSTLLYSGNPAVNAAFTLSDYIGNYNILRIVDTYHYQCDVYMPVHTSTQIIMANGSTSYSYDGTSRFLLWEFTATSSDGINYTVARKAQTNITSTGVEFITTNADFGIQIYGLR